ncbi:RNA-directed DNA polymerase, eukaryota, reverse transcriptase zinc-binding domain protein, partial [Tanacetum coccineum]
VLLARSNIWRLRPTVMKQQRRIIGFMMVWCISHGALEASVVKWKEWPEKGQGLHLRSLVEETKWCKIVPRKVNVFMWRLKCGRIPVRTLLHNIGTDLHSTLCPHCDEAIETIDHSMVQCKFISLVWLSICAWWNIGSFVGSSVHDVLNLAGFGSSKLRSYWEAVKWTSLYHIWRARNNKVFQGKQMSAVDLVFLCIGIEGSRYFYRCVIHSTSHILDSSFPHIPPPSSITASSPTTNPDQKITSLFESRFAAFMFTASISLNYRLYIMTELGPWKESEQKDKVICLRLNRMAELVERDEPAPHFITFEPKAPTRDGIPEPKRRHLCGVLDTPAIPQAQRTAFDVNVGKMSLSYIKRARLFPRVLSLFSKHKLYSKSAGNSEETISHVDSLRRPLARSGLALQCGQKRDLNSRYGGTNIKKAHQ